MIFVVAPAVIAGTPAPVLPRKEMTIQDLWGILSRRRKIVLGVLLGHDRSRRSLVCDVHPSLQGLRRDPGTKGVGRCVKHGHHDGARVCSRTRLTSNIKLQTQAQILQSDSLALQVVKELNLEDSPDFRSHFNPIGWVMGLVCARRHSGPGQCTLRRCAGAPRPRDQESLNPISRSRLSPALV